MECTVREFHVDVSPPYFLIVEGVVFDTCRDAVALHTLDIGNHQFSGKEGILAHVFEVASV